MRLKLILTGLALSLTPAGTSQAHEDFAELLYAVVGGQDPTSHAPVGLFGSEGAPRAPCSPEAGTLVGGYTRGGSTTWVFRVPDRGTQALERCTKKLVEAGFALGKGQGGLVEVANFATLCRDWNFLSLQLSRSAVHWYLSETFPAYKGDCDLFSNNLHDFPIEIPPLVPRTGVQSSTWGTTYSGTEYHSSQGLYFDEYPTNLVDYYASQLEAAGWNPREKTIGQSSWIVGAERTVESKLWLAQLVAFRGPKSVSLHLIVLRDSPE